MARHAGNGRAGGQLLERFVRFEKFMRFVRFNEFNTFKRFKRLGFWEWLKIFNPHKRLLFVVCCLAFGVEWSNWNEIQSSIKYIISKIMNTLKTFRYIALAEGISFLILLFIAMPLKYLANMPEPVKLFGMMHGVLFVLFIIFKAYSFYLLKKSRIWYFEVQYVILIESW